MLYIEGISRNKKKSSPFLLLYQEFPQLTSATQSWSEDFRESKHTHKAHCRKAPWVCLRAQIGVDFVLVFLQEEEEREGQAAKDLFHGVFHTISMKTLNTYNARSFNSFELFQSLKKSLFISSRSNEKMVLCLVMIKTS